MCLKPSQLHPEVSLDALQWLLQGANDAVAAQQVAGTLTADMRTTIVVLLLDLYSGAALWAHAGDSRLYHWHDARLLGRTRDQSLEQRLLDAGLSATAAASGELTSALGSPEGFEFEILETPQMLASGDALLLCSDGLWSAFDDVAMARSVVGCSGVQAWLGRLEAGVQQADRSDQDNYSALAVWCTARLNIEQFEQERRLRWPGRSPGKKIVRGRERPPEAGRRRRPGLRWLEFLLGARRQGGDRRLERFGSFCCRGKQRREPCSDFMRWRRRGKAFGQRQWKSASYTIVRSHDDAAPDLAGRRQRQIAPRREGAQAFAQRGAFQRRGGEGEATLQPAVPVAAPACRQAAADEVSRARAACPTRRRDAAAASPFCLRATKSRQLPEGPDIGVGRAGCARLDLEGACVDDKGQPCRRAPLALPVAAQQYPKPGERAFMDLGADPGGAGRQDAHQHFLRRSRSRPEQFLGAWRTVLEAQQLTIDIDAELQQLRHPCAGA